MDGAANGEEVEAFQRALNDPAPARHGELLHGSGKRARLTGVALPVDEVEEGAVGAEAAGRAVVVDGDADGAAQGRAVVGAGGRGGGRGHDN